ncbi:hypothetical protein ACNI3K_08155 [Demequina sp. SO4-13]|uniref:hypothetical protein n=1 Tax=Demequina sp. SO4-13 TaxID=3401027 RepID=UPI003AF6B6B1
MSTHADERRDRSVLNIFAAGAGVASLLLPVVGVVAGTAALAITLRLAAGWAGTLAEFD